MKKYDQEFSDLKYLRTIVEAYEEIASNRLRHVKDAVLQNRVYLADLTKIYAQLKFSYNKEVSKLITNTRSLLRKTNGKTVYVFLSANTGLYGSVISATFYKFIDSVKRSPNSVDLVIVGKVGKRLYNSYKSKIPEGKVKYFDLPDNGEDIPLKEALFNHLVNYEKIVMYHGQFENILVQSPHRSFISGDSITTKKQIEAHDIKYIFEPSLEKVLTYFEKEILTSLFEQSLHESGLSKFASRMISLDKATNNIDTKLHSMKIQVHKMRHKEQASKQLNTLTSVFRNRSIKRARV